MSAEVLRLPLDQWMVALIEGGAHFVTLVRLQGELYVSAFPQNGRDGKLYRVLEHADGALDVEIQEPVILDLEEDAGTGKVGSCER